MPTSKNEFVQIVLVGPFVRPYWDRRTALKLVSSHVNAYLTSSNDGSFLKRLNLVGCNIPVTETHVMSKKRKKCTDGSASDYKISGKCGDNQMRHKPAVGNILWVRMPDFSWWPAQVVGCNYKIGNYKSKRRKEGEVLARLYGSSELWYVDPAKCHSDFQNALKQNNLSFREIFQKSLEQGTSQSGFISCSKRVARGFKEQTRFENPEDEVKENMLKQKRKENAISQKIDSSGRQKAAEQTRFENPEDEVKENMLKQKRKENVISQKMDSSRRRKAAEQTRFEIPEDEVKENTLKQKRKENVISQKMDSSGRRKAAEQARFENPKDEVKENILKQKRKENVISQKMDSSGRRKAAEQTRFENSKDEVKENMLKQKWKEDVISQNMDSSGRRKASNTQRVTKKTISEGVRMKSNKDAHRTDDLDYRLHSPKDSPNSSLRPKKMMQKLGLIAPRGSPFCKNGLHLIT
ncbi:hypothetical protein H6P81_010779 [Aristolochia fimbriata]|uniref:PWWP domain-containing protein n=1 Tax=Aristolochia fimbriata TaxID=158543 RepID=A0AAV7EQD5_ARIFI|nr:hypothetical protein H6P81_010779 [Aristolochia fimbriata]